MHSKDERIWNSHGEDDPKWIMKGKKNEYESSKFTRVRVRDGIDKDKDRDRDNVVAKAVATPSSPLSDTPSRNKKIKRGSKFGSPMSKFGERLTRYLKYLTKKYLKKHNVRDWLRVVASNKERNSLQYCVTREYITHRSKRVADAVEAAMEDEHGPNASQHPPNDFDLWEKATGGKKKGKLVGLGTQGDPRHMVTSRTSSSSSSSHAHHTGSQPSEHAQMLEETIRQLQEDNTQMRARVEIETQVQVQSQVERQVQEHMRQRELEANACEEAREREWQQRWMIFTRC
ncbi:transposase, Ptta/En/Spm [Tanacetum coccineum]